MKTTKGGKVMNPTDAYRKELRKKELKRNKKERKKVREVGILKKDPETIREQIDKLEMMKADGALDKARKHKKRQLEDTLSMVLKKRKEYEEKMRDKGEAPVMFSHLGPPRRRTTAEEEERVKHPKPEDSVYYHPTLNPTGAPPPGKPPMYKSSIGPRIPLGASSSIASSSNPDEEEGLAAPPPPPPALPSSGELAADDSDLPKSLPLPPPPPAPPKRAAETPSLPGMPPPPPPPPGPPPNAQVRIQALPPPPPPPSGMVQTERVSSMAESLDHAPARLPPPPPPPGFPPKPANQHSEVGNSELNAGNSSGINDYKSMISLPLPPRPPPPPAPPGVLVGSLQHDAFTSGIARIPPPPPPLDMRPPLASGLPDRPPPPPPGILAPPGPRPGFPALIGLPPMSSFPPMMRPPLQPGLAHQGEQFSGIRPPPYPSYVKSAASTVVKRPLAQHNPELTAMVPASVRVRRETAVPKTKPKAQASSAAPGVLRPTTTVVVGKAEKTSASASAPKSKSIDDSYMAFLEDMKALGALDS